MCKKIYTGLAVGMLLVGMVGVAQADSITITGTVRDFHADGAWFEGSIDGVVPGLVNSTLDDTTKNPTRTAVTTPSMPGDQSFFGAWYDDVPGTNKSKSLSLTLAESGGVYSYANNSFFPIDGELFGNEGNAHNYHFTFELHNSFTYQGGETFSFTGDDDLWVFIDNKLAIDLGGVHGAVTGTVDLDTFAFANGLTIGQDYDFDLYFAERHTTQSNFSFDTSIKLNNPVPEPATMLLFGTGLAGLAGVARRRKKD